VTAFKIDENLHPDVASFLRGHGYDAVTVWDQDLRGTPDANLAEVCRTEGRTLLTLDLDFADIRAYPPEEYPGLIVLRVAHQDRMSVLETLGRVVPLLERESLDKHLRIVDEQSVRIRGPNEDANQDDA
jgi:predicted nuclease of predicted toxin-antitoxin system